MRTGLYLQRTNNSHVEVDIFFQSNVFNSWELIPLEKEYNFIGSDLNCVMWSPSLQHMLVFTNKEKIFPVRLHK